MSVEYCDSSHHSPDVVIHKAEELVQEVNRLRTKSTSAESHVSNVETELRSCRDALDRANIEKEQIQRQAASQLLDLERLRQVLIQGEVLTRNVRDSS